MSNGSRGATAAVVAPPLLDNAVVFLFAHQRLLFRYPLLNPFEVKMPSATQQSCPSAAPQNTPLLLSPTELLSESSAGHTSALDGAVASPSTSAAAASTVVPSPLMATSNAASVGGVTRMPTCCGIETSIVLFLLRNSYSRLTTLRIGICTLLIHPLLGVDGEASLVVMLRVADDAYGHVSRYLQTVINALLREEQRCLYVSDAVRSMMGELERGASASGHSTVEATTPSAASRRPLSSKVSVCATGATVPLSTQLTGVFELDVFSRAASTTPSLFYELRLVAETVNGCNHNDCHVNQFLLLPHSHLSGHIRQRRQIVATFSSRFAPGTVVTIRDSDFVSARRQQYEHVFGSVVATSLLPLHDVDRVFRSLQPPWTLFSVRSELESLVRERMLEREREEVLGSPRQPTTSHSSGSSFAKPAGGISDHHPQASSVLDAPFLVFEVIEFLRLFGALTFHLQVAVFTHSALARWRPRTPSPVKAFDCCIFGPTCTQCGRHATMNKRHGASSYQQLLFDFYNNQYDDPWFQTQASLDGPQRSGESVLPRVENDIPSVRVYETLYEGCRRGSAEGVSTKDCAADSMKVSGAQLSTKSTSLSSAEDVSTAARAWLERHACTIQTRLSALVMLLQDADSADRHTAAQLIRDALQQTNVDDAELDSRGIADRYHATPVRRTNALTSSPPGSPTVAGSHAPFGALLQVVVHVVVAALWGAVGGVAFDDLVTTTDGVLRRFSPMLRNLSYVQRRQSRAEAAAAAPLTDAEKAVLATADVMDALGLMGVVKPYLGLAVRRVPVRVLVHTAVNVLSDVVFAGLVAVHLPSAAAL